LTIGVQANILAIHEKLVRLMSRDGAGTTPVGSHFLLQGNGTDSLRWNDDALDTFLKTQVQEKFGVSIQRRHIRCTINGTQTTVGDLSIAISMAIQRQHRPRRTLVN
jgi:hypothetical protein